jgi:hypothetical protein
MCKDSGSPVFNNKWELVALHSRAGKGRFKKGVAIATIVDDLPASVKAPIGVRTLHGQTPPLTLEYGCSIPRDDPCEVESRSLSDAMTEGRLAPA